VLAARPLSGSGPKPKLDFRRAGTLATFPGRCDDVAREPAKTSIEYGGTSYGQLQTSAFSLLNSYRSDFLFFPEFVKPCERTVDYEVAFSGGTSQEKNQSLLCAEDGAMIARHKRPNFNS
jgi:hypothetical protein